MNFQESDFDVSTYVHSRNFGGTKIGVQVLHKPSGKLEREASQRSEHANKDIAWRRLCTVLAAMPDADTGSFRVALVWSSADPRKSIPFLAKEFADEREVETHHHFIRWLAPRQYFTAESK